MPVGQPILAVEGVTKRFGPNEVLKNVTLSIGAQEIRAICGENGAGKSTLVKVFTGVHQVDGGVVLVDGKPTAIPSPLHAQELGIALVAQELSLAPACRCSTTSGSATARCRCFIAARNCATARARRWKRWAWATCRSRRRCRSSASAGGSSSRSPGC